MPDEMRGRIARALMREAGDDPDADIWCDPRPWFGASDAVLAGIEAAGMVIIPREPTHEMVKEGAKAWTYHNGCDEPYEREIPDVWQAMIDAATPTAHDRET